MGASLPELVTQIVSNVAQSRTISTEEVVGMIEKVHLALKNCAENATPAMTSELQRKRQNAMSSIGKQSITCLECGKAFKLLANRHLSLHGLTPTEYKDKWGIKRGTALSSAVLTQSRRKTAHERGFGSGLSDYRKDKANGLASTRQAS